MGRSVREAAVGYEVKRKRQNRRSDQAVDAADDGCGRYGNATISMPRSWNGACRSRDALSRCQSD